MRFTDTRELPIASTCSQEVLTVCRSHIESMQNLTYIATLEKLQSLPSRVNLGLMEWHLRRLSEVLFSPA